MQIIEIKTLIDITDSNVSRPKQGSQLEYDQYRNFTTLKQCVELRSIISYDSAPSCETADVKELGFGSKYKGKQKVWTWRFSPDRSGAYENHGSPVGDLIDDVDQVPIIKKLSETINIEKAIFELKDQATKNTVIKAIPGAI